MDWIAGVVSLWLTSLVWIGGLAVVFLVLTRFSPCNPGQNWWTDRRAAVTDLVYWLVLPLVTQVGRVVLLVGGVLLVYGNSPPDDWAVRRWPVWVQCLVILVIQDVILYWLHRLFHTPVGWRFHAVHHSPEVLDWTSTQRFHPVNAVLEFAVADVVILLLGFSPDAVVILGPLNLAYSVMVHANLNWTFGPLRYLLVSPVYHRWHHTSDEQGRDRNFASTFPFLDLLFGTYHMPVGQRPEVYGTTDRDVPRGFVGQMTYPFLGIGGWVGRRPVFATLTGATAAAGLAFGLVQLLEHLETPTPEETAELARTAIMVNPPAGTPPAAASGRQTSSVAVAVRRSRVYLGGSDGSLVVRDAAGNERSVPAHVQRLNATAVSPDETLVATCGSDGAARVWSTESGELLRTLPGHGTGVMCVAVAADGSAATGSADGVVRVWNPGGELTAVHRTDGPVPIHTVAVSDQGSQVVYAQLSTAALWDTAADRVTPLREQTTLAYCVGMSADGRTVLTGGYDGLARLWDGNGHCRTVLSGHEGPVYAASVTRDGTRVVTGGADRTVRVWQVADGRLIRELGGHTEQIFAVSADDGGRRIAAVGKGGYVSVWEVPDADVIPARAVVPVR